MMEDCNPFKELTETVKQAAEKMYGVEMDFSEAEKTAAALWDGFDKDFGITYELKLMARDYRRYQGTTTSTRATPPIPAPSLGPESRQVRRAKERAFNKLVVQENRKSKHKY